MLTQQALGKSYPDKFRVIKHKWNSLLFQGNEKEIPAHLCSISNLITLFFYSQAGKHRLFLNILLFGKLLIPIWRRPVSIPPSVRQTAPVSNFVFFLSIVNSLKNSYYFLLLQNIFINLFYSCSGATATNLMFHTGFFLLL